MEQDEVENIIIWNGILQDFYTWDMISNQEKEWYVESIQTYRGWPGQVTLDTQADFRNFVMLAGPVYSHWT